ncbi:MAG: MFS transporter [Gordonibacter sp.]|uniref:MFS transporter n=1 Tax=Gordonibacter sp. TaxID=1968902 RepID=UPI002FCA0A07
MKTNKQYGNWVLIAVVMLLFGTAIATIQFKVPVVMGDVMVKMNMDANSASWLMSIFTFVGIILALPTGALAKKFGPKTMLLAAAAIIAAGSLLGAFAGNGMILIVSRAIEGVAFIFVTICGPLAVQKYVAPDKIGSATGIWALWVCLGSVVGGVLTPTLYSSTGFVGVWIIYAVAAVVFAVVVAVVVKDPRKALEEASEAPAEEKINYGDLVKPNILLFLVAFLVFNMTLMAVLGFGPTFMQQQGVEPTLSGFISTLPMLLAVISSPLFGALSDKLGRRKPLYLFALFVMGPCTLILLTQTGPLMWAGAIVMGLVGLGGPVMCLTSYIHVLGRPELMSIGMGVLMLVQSLGQFLGTWLVPLLLGPDVSSWMFTGIVMCVLGFIGTGALALCKFK